MFIDLSLLLPPRSSILACAHAQHIYTCTPYTDVTTHTPQTHKHPAVSPNARPCPPKPNHSPPPPSMLTHNHTDTHPPPFTILNPTPPTEPNKRQQIYLGARGGARKAMSENLCVYMCIYTHPYKQVFDSYVCNVCDSVHVCM